MAEFFRSKGKNAPAVDVCQQAWDELNLAGALPRTKDTEGNKVAIPYIARNDGLGRGIPNLCLKVPTGGGKTLLAAAAVERINGDFFGRQTGFLLWIVPSDAIYRQTWKALANREHPYRQMLERASGGRVKVLEREDSFSRQDTENCLCVMLLMLQAAGRQTKDTLRMFRDTGNFGSFFPEVDDPKVNAALLADVRNLDENDLADAGMMQGQVSVRHSLGNVLRLVRPIIILDEGHKAYSLIQLDTLCGFNPRFILELTATPNTRVHMSNVLVNVPGAELKAAEMVKLPINAVNAANAGWKHALDDACAQLEILKGEAITLQHSDGRYIRPMMLVRVDRTGKEQRDGLYIHAEDVREYLIEKQGAKLDSIRLKTAETDELGDEDLLDPLCPVRFVITKAALQEGWDCPFAYILAVLSNTQATTALTQMVGRVLRQPEARLTSRPLLNECWVFTADQVVQESVGAIKRGLEEEGMGDLASLVKEGGTGSAGTKTKRRVVKRREPWRGAAIFLPQVLHREGKGKDGYRELDYERDILGHLDWDQFHFLKADSWTPDAAHKLQRVIVRVDVSGTGSHKDGSAGDGPFVVLEDGPDDWEVDTRLDVPHLVRQLTDVIPNPWQGVRILNDTLAAVRGKGTWSERELFANRLVLVKEMKDDLREQVFKASESLFRAKLEKGEIAFHLVSANDAKLNWELAESMELDLGDTDHILRRKQGGDLERALFEEVYQKHFNNLERDVAWYLDGQETVHWWHRIAERQDYGVQGWWGRRVYPDFLVSLTEMEDGRACFALLETKGEHLSGAGDTERKRRLFELLTEHSKKAVRAGELALAVKDAELHFEMLLEQDWRTGAEKALKIGKGKGAGKK
ncbi:DEAD/DEAH box helicase family protein [Roseimicrobium sp. ORNL1]|nr:DEAD/DEAH box helicase family protein [Roseimicrobium sp. ORNL1]